MSTRSNADDEGNQSLDPQVFLIEDDPALRQALETTLAIKRIPFRSFPDAEAALEALQAANCCTLISDIRLPEMSGLELLFKVRREQPDLPIILMTAYADAQTAVQALKGGARDFLMKPFKPDQFIETVRRYLKSNNDPTSFIDGPVVVDPLSRRLVQTLARVAQSDASVLLLGESGVGKEVMAQFLHRNSQRRTQAFVPINCAAIPSSLLEATLFGHERGAFTGASKAQQGKFELAQGGTIFLDEIGEMPLELQTKLLRVLQERQVERVGSNQTISLDVRLITATNQDLLKRVEEGLFREDLYYRINVFPIRIPALRERIEDIAPLADRFLLKYRASMGQPEARLGDEARECLRSHTWPGNVRELENAVQRALLLCNGTLIYPEDFGIDFAKRQYAVPKTGHGSETSSAWRSASPPQLDAGRQTTDEKPGGYPKDTTAVKSGNASAPGDLPKVSDVKSIERDHILQVLKDVGGNRRRAIEVLGISERTLRYKLKLWREAGYDVPRARDGGRDSNLLT